ncbi:selenocysteine insertion sequence-binding protein 2 isoform X4 [Bos indicus x Bos taurus]|uniref:selenocysteine insertion sequence-binding protein 2 isoform X4 n=1 Tax=Bos indicus x Bos taurus TaxID=30522 RepID=UPI000F7D4D86|nr:selenocysteine insertion sequence-binding protein 2 isoform X4 [Bos indicus x Bos taurus]
MASEGRREPAAEGIKLSADVKPFVPKFAGLNVGWSESSEARVFPSCAATPYYPCVQELAVPEQKLYTDDMAFGASAFPSQYFSAEIPLHPYAYSPYTLQSPQNVCPVPGSPYDDNQPSCFGGFQRLKPRSEHTCPLSQDTKAVFKKKTYDEQKFDSKKTDGPVSSDLKSVKDSPRVSIHAENSLKSDGYYKRTDRKSRIIEKSGSASKPEFGFTRLDFPELQSPENSEIPKIQKQPKWGPLRSTSTDISLLREMGTPSAVLSETLSTELSPAPKNVTSMINLKMVASPADPKNDSMSSSEVLSLEPSYKEKHVVHLTEKSKASQGGNPEQNEASRKNKKKKEKSKSKYEVLTVQEPPRIENNFKSSRKKSQIPVQLDLGGMLTALEKKQHSPNAKQSSKPVVFSVGAVPVLSKDSMSGKKGHRLAQVKTPHNPLDSTSPMMKKGKQREVPKAKKPTPLKKIILKERQERKQQRLQENALSPAFPSDDVQDVQDEESGGDDQVLRPPDMLGEMKESVSCVPVVESKSEEQPGAEPQKETEACPKIHSRRFRDYCSQMLSKEVDACVTDLLKELVRFQDRMYQKDPVKAKAKRRLVLGLREVLKHLKLRKLKCIIISPNCEKIQSKGGLDDTLHTIIDYACDQNIPFVFALNRKALGRSLNKAVPVSVVGIFSYDGAQDQFHKMVELTMAARQAYRTMLENARQELPGELGPCAPVGPPSQGPGCPVEDSPLAPTEKEEPHYIQVWRNHVEAYSRCGLELEESLEASTSQMMNLNL